MTPIPTSIHTPISTSALPLTPVSPLTSPTTYHVTIDNLRELGSQPEPLWYIILVALITAYITAGLTSYFKDKAYRKLKEDEKREKLYKPLRFYLSTLRSIDKHYEKIGHAGDEAEKYAQKIHDPELRMKEDDKVLKSRGEFFNKATIKWRECLDKIYELLQSNPGLIKEEHYKTVDKFNDAYIAAHYVDNSTSEVLEKLAPINYYFEKTNIKYFKKAVHELEETILGSTLLDTR